ncbi:hypothetical protein TNCV_1130021, partial [Trichonephila clavipes]
MLLNANGRELGQCPFCNQTTCHRWIAVQGMCAILSTHQSHFIRDWLLVTLPTSCFERIKKTRLDASYQSTLRFSARWTKLMPFRAHFHDRNARDAAETRRFGICRSARTRTGVHHLQEPNAKRVFVLFCKDRGTKKTLLDNFKRAILEAKHLNSQARRCLVGENLKGLLRNPRSNPEKYRQEDGVHLQQHVFVKKTLRLAFRR